jgi:hypothetical protein
VGELRPSTGAHIIAGVAMELELVKALLAALAHEGVEYVLVGGVAINVHGLGRATKDIDLFVRPEPGNIARLKRALHSVFADPSIDEIAAGDLMGPYPTVRYGPPQGTFFIDILTRLGDAFGFDDLEAEHLVLDGVPVTVATPRTLYLMKKGTIRLQDRADAEALKRRFGIED